MKQGWGIQTGIKERQGGRSSDQWKGDSNMRQPGASLEV